MKHQWIVGTRGSKLALKQTEIVVGKLGRLYPDHAFDIRIIKTTGDSVWDTPLYLIGQKGLFIKEIEDALSRGEIDLAVHSMKDLPTELIGGCAISAVLTREDPSDTFLSHKHLRLIDVPHGGRVGTSSMRRKAQLLAFRKDLEIVPLRGNVDTRVRKLTEQDLDGIILARAGVIRMGLQSHIKEILDVKVMVPPGGQGAIGIETRAGDDAAALVRPLNDRVTAREVQLERMFQTSIGGGCSVPLGVNARIAAGGVTIHAVFGTEDGRIVFKRTAAAPEDQAEDLVKELVADLKQAQQAAQL